MSKVSVLRVENYDPENLERKIKEALDLIGGIDDIIAQDAKVFIKLNALGPFPKETGIVTHPAVLEAVVKAVLTRTKDITVGDNPATRDIKYVLAKTGNDKIIEKYGLKVMDGKESVHIENPKAAMYHEFDISRAYLDCDVIINLPKLKTHSLTYMTCAEKNFFGLIYGFNKASWHVKASNPLDFGNALNDLFGAFLHAFGNRKILHICDGIVGLDGDGPSTGGKTRKAHAIIASLDAVAVDTIACKLVKLDPKRLFVTDIAHKRGFGENENIELLGDSWDKFDDVRFDGPQSAVGGLGVRILRRKFFRNLLLEHPAIDKNICLRCGECAKICPPGAMKIKPGEFPHLTKKNCIRCWCCAEVCPVGAVKKSKRPLFGRAVFKQ